MDPLQEKLGHSRLHKKEGFSGVGKRRTAYIRGRWDGASIYSGVFCPAGKAVFGYDSNMTRMTLASFEPF